MADLRLNLLLVEAGEVPVACRLRAIRESGEVATVHEWTVAAGDACQVGIGGGTWLEVRDVEPTIEVSQCSPS